MSSVSERTARHQRIMGPLLVAAILLVRVLPQGITGRYLRRSL